MGPLLNRRLPLLTRVRILSISSVCNELTAPSAPTLKNGNLMSKVHETVADRAIQFCQLSEQYRLQANAMQIRFVGLQGQNTGKNWNQELQECHRELTRLRFLEKDYKDRAALACNQSLCSSGAQQIDHQSHTQQHPPYQPSQVGQHHQTQQPQRPLGPDAAKQGHRPHDIYAEYWRTQQRGQGRAFGL